MKFIHLSNVNLGMPSDVSAHIVIDRAKEYEEDFGRVLAKAREAQVDALFVTGNLFAHAPSAEELARVDEMLLTLGGTRVFVLTGKADASADDALASYEWKSATTVFSGDNIQRIFISRLDLEVTGVGYGANTWEKVKPENLKRGRKGALQILLLPFLGNGDEALAAEQIPAMPFDYIGIGQTVQITGMTGKPVYAPGMFEAEPFSEEKSGWYLGELTVDKKGRSSLNVSLEPSAKRAYKTLQVTVTEETSIAGLEADIRSQIASQGVDNVYRIELRGIASIAVHYMKDRLYSVGLVEEVVDLTVYSKENEVGEADELICRFLGEMEKISDETLRNKATAYGLSALLNQRKEGV